MHKVLFGITAAAIALSAAAASAENAVPQARERLAAEFAKQDVADRTTGTRQITSGVNFGLFDTIFGADVSLGAADTGKIDANRFGRPSSFATGPINR
ncbi:MAG: hypothetical protein AAGC57_16920 [Pseudomonadota bacterium]